MLQLQRQGFSQTGAVERLKYVEISQGNSSTSSNTFSSHQFPTLSQLRILLRKVYKAIPNIGFNTFFPGSQVTNSTTPTKNYESAVNSYVSQVPQSPPYTAPSCSMVRSHVLRYVWSLLAFLALFQGRSPRDFASDAPQASSSPRVRKRTRKERTLVDPCC